MSTRRNFMAVVTSAVAAWFTRRPGKPQADPLDEPGYDAPPRVGRPTSPTRLAFSDDSHQPEAPRPFKTKAVTTPRGDWTTIQRDWNHGDSVRCRLCPLGRCIAQDDSCLLMVPGRVNAKAASRYDANGLAWPEGGGR